MSRQFLQRALCCPCGRNKVVALGLCPTCYTLRRQDEANYAGNRERVLMRDGYRCRIPGCYVAGKAKRTLSGYHRVPGDNHPSLMITLCLAHHAVVTRNQVLRKDWSELLRTLWREQHPQAHEQSNLAFNAVDNELSTQIRFLGHAALSKPQTFIFPLMPSICMLIFTLSDALRNRICLNTWDREDADNGLII